MRQATSSPSASAAAARIGRAGAALRQVDRDADDLDARPRAVRLEDAPVVGVDAGRDRDARATREPARHEGRLGRGGGAVVVRGGRHLHPGQLADERLELVDALQRALRDLRLVRRVGGRELGAPDHLADHGRDQVAVDAGPEEADLGDPVAAGEPCQLGADLLLDEGRRHVPGAGADRGGNVVEQVVDRCDADGVEHPSVVGLGVRGVGHRRAALRRSRRRTRRRP